MVRVKGSETRDREGESEIQDVQVSLRMGLGAEVGSPVGTGHAEGKTMHSQPRALSEDIRSGLRKQFQGSSHFPETPLPPQRAT